MNQLNLLDTQVTEDKIQNTAGNNTECNHVIDRYPYIWSWGNPEKYPVLASYKGRKCIVLVRSRRFGNSCLIEFEDGYMVVTSRNGIRKHAQ